MRYRAMVCLVLALALAVPGAASAGHGYADYLAESQIGQRLREISNTRLIDVPGRGQATYYAQTNPFWAEMRYEAAGSATFRRFGEGGCLPTSIAMALANLLDAEQLAAIRAYASPKVKGFGVSAGVVNPLNMNHQDGVYWLNRAQDYYDLLPLVLGQFAAGNNSMREIWRVRGKDQGSNGGTSGKLVPVVAKVYGLTCELVKGKDNTDFLLPIREGATAVALANSRVQPFVKSLGHYVTVIGADEEYFYILDPQDKTEYEETDKFGVLDVVEPGLVRVKISDMLECQLSHMYIFSTPEIDEKIARAREAEGKIAGDAAADAADGA